MTPIDDVCVRARSSAYDASSLHQSDCKYFSWHLTPYTSHLTPHTSHLTPHTSHLTPHTSHLTPHTSHLTPHTSHLTPHTSHLTPHTSHLTPHTSHAPHLMACATVLLSFTGRGACALMRPVACNPICSTMSDLRKLRLTAHGTRLKVEAPTCRSRHRRTCAGVRPPSKCKWK